MDTENKNKDTHETGIHETYKNLAERMIAGRYSPSKESQLQRRMINLLLAPDETDPVTAEAIRAEYEDYNTYVEGCLEQARTLAGSEYVMRQNDDIAERHYTPVRNTIGAECHPREAQ